MKTRLQGTVNENAASIRRFRLYHATVTLPFLRSCQPLLLIVPFYFLLIRSPADPAYTSSIFVHGPLRSRFHNFRFWTVDLGRSVMLRLFFSHGLAMFPLADSLTIVAKLTQQWHDIFKCFVHCVWP